MTHATHAACVNGPVHFSLFFEKRTIFSERPLKERLKIATKNCVTTNNRSVHHPL